MKASPVVAVFDEWEFMLWERIVKLRYMHQNQWAEASIEIRASAA